MEHIAPIILAIVAAMTALGAVAKFVWDKIENRFVDIETKLEACEKREGSSKDRRAVHLIVIELLWAELKQIAPESLALKRGKKLLDELKSLQVEDDH